MINIVPDWYAQARIGGTPKEMLLSQVRDFCLKAMQYRAQKNGEPLPSSVDESVVEITQAMYETALQVAPEHT